MPDVAAPAPADGAPRDGAAPRVSIERLADRVLRLLRQELAHEQRRGGDPLRRPPRR